MIQLIPLLAVNATSAVPALTGFVDSVMTSVAGTVGSSDAAAFLTAVTLAAAFVKWGTVSQWVKYGLGFAAIFFFLKSVGV